MKKKKNAENEKINNYKYIIILDFINIGFN